MSSTTIPRNPPRATTQGPTGARAPVVDAPVGTSGTTAATTTPTDAFEPAPTTTPLRHGGLPDVLLRTASAEVGHGTDPGDFYCEHMFFTTQQEAMKQGSAVRTNAHGEKLVGFLHIPRDAQTSVDGGTWSQAERHADTRDVVGAALRGYYDDVAARDRSGPVRIMLNGYDTFMDVRNNPTGDFVSHRENVDAAMRRAFGPDLITVQGEPHVDAGRPAKVASQTWQYEVRDPQTRKVRSVLVHTQNFAVADQAINGTRGQSVQSAMDAFRPHAVISMGVASGSYLAEFHADNGGLRLGPGRDRGHDDAAVADQTLPDNYSLARAIHRGSTASVAPTLSLARLLTGGAPQG